MLKPLRRHYPEYLMEAWGLGAFMVAATLARSISRVVVGGFGIAIRRNENRFIGVAARFDLTRSSSICVAVGSGNGQSEIAIRLTCLAIAPATVNCVC